MPRKSGSVGGVGKRRPRSTRPLEDTPFVPVSAIERRHLGDHRRGGVVALIHLRIQMNQIRSP
jgi:hypothetical protein